MTFPDLPSSLKEHLRTLGMIFEHYGRLLPLLIYRYIYGRTCRSSVASSETVTFAEFSNALSNPVLLTIVNFSPMQGSIIMELTSGLGYAIIDRMLGGKGETLEKTREFSEIEMSIIERIHGYLYAAAQGTIGRMWRRLIHLSGKN